MKKFPAPTRNARKRAYVAGGRRQFHPRTYLFILVVATLLGLITLLGSFRSLGNTVKADIAQCGSTNSRALSGLFDPTDKLAYFMDEPVSPLGRPLAKRGVSDDQQILGETSGEKWIDVDLTTQTVRAMEGDREVFRFLVSTGKWAQTPTGEYRVWIKLRYTKMSGGSKEKHTYYYLPNVPYVMYFYQGYGLHGAYWHNNFGQPMSHGCVNMAIPDSEQLFYWAEPVLPEGASVVRASSDNPGTKVVIHGTTPL